MRFRPDRFRFACTVDDCSWTLDPGMVPAQPLRIPIPLDESPNLDGMITAAVDEMAACEAVAIEAVLRAHLAEHDLLDFVRTINRLQQELAQHDSGIRPHVGVPFDFVEYDEWRLTGQPPNFPAYDFTTSDPNHIRAIRSLAAKAAENGWTEVHLTRRHVKVERTAWAEETV